MNITKETKLKDLLTEYPRLRNELVTISDKFKMLNTPLGKVMENKATVEEMSKRSGVDVDILIAKLTELIQNIDK